MDEQGSRPADGAPKVEVRRSSRRKRTVTAYRERDTIVVLLPARMSAREERDWVDQMVRKVLAREARVALTLRVVGGLTSDEIARAFLVPTATVQARITRAKKTLGTADYTPGPNNPPTPAACS